MCLGHLDYKGSLHQNLLPKPLDFKTLEEPALLEHVLSAGEEV
jgi:hypothetical protein